MGWSVPPGGMGLRLSSQGNSITTIQGGGQAAETTVLGFVNIGTAVASAVVNIWALPKEATSLSTSATSGATLVAKIDASSTSGRAFTYMIRSAGGWWANMQGGNADATITFF